MPGKYERDYITKHERIRNKLLEMVKNSDRACFEVAKIAAELGMDQRTIRAHLKIMEVDSIGVFMDPSEKQFCTKEGISMLASMMKPDGKV